MLNNLIIFLDSTFLFGHPDRGSGDNCTIQLAERKNNNTGHNCFFCTFIGFLCFFVFLHLISKYSTFFVFFSLLLSKIQYITYR